jgi:hypothetical protein
MDYAMKILTMLLIKILTGISPHEDLSKSL